MKKIITLVWVAMVCMSFVACGSESNKNTKDTREDVETSSVESTEENKQAEETSKVESTQVTSTSPEIQKTSLSIGDFENLLNQMPVFVKSTKYTVQDEQYKSLYPDMLQAVLQNSTSSDVKNAVVAFVAWDSNNLPVKIKGSLDFSDGTYIQMVNYNDINMVPNSTFGESSGFEIDESCNISTFKAVVVSFETFEGDTWENPYYDEWCKLYEGVKYSDELVVDVLVEDAKFEAAQQDTEDGRNNSITEAELLEQIEQQEFKVISTKYVVQDEQYKALYPDMLQAILQNNTTYDIKNAVVAFVAWDSNNLPVKIKDSIDYSDGTYIKQVNYGDINLIPNGTFGESSGYEIDETCGIKTFKAIVVSYETFDGNTWENPLYDEWCKLYGGVKLK